MAVQPDDRDGLIRKLYGLGLGTQAEIGDRFGLTRARIQQIIAEPKPQNARILNKLAAFDRLRSIDAHHLLSEGNGLYKIALLANTTKPIVEQFFNEVGETDGEISDVEFAGTVPLEDHGAVSR